MAPPPGGPPGHVPQHAGRMSVTTLKLAPEDGPMATALLETLIQRIATE